MSSLNESVDNAGGLPVNIVKGTHSQLILFLVFNMWPSHFGLPALLAIVLLSKRVKRHPTFVNFAVAFIIIGFSSSLLVYAGRTTGPEPSRMLCLLQASLLYGMPSIASTAALSLVLQMFFMIKAAYDGVKYLDGDHIIRLWLMLVGPYVAFFTSILATAVIGAANPSRVSRSRRFFYCSLESLPLTNTLTIFSAIILMSTFIMMVWTLVLLYRRVKLARMHGPHAPWTVDVDLSFPYRIMVFGLYIIVSLSLSLLSIQSPSSPVPDLVIASAATGFILVFGTQADILRVLCFWKPPKPHEVSESFHLDLKDAFEDKASLRRSGSDKPLPPRPFPA
ncbi:hypothetical protein BDZ97DRAFT_1775186 [Flammula alnicola]|nr:hypothetical protein BDZ97DRAFT_1775186 [Flammula alnicola]